MAGDTPLRFSEYRGFIELLNEDGYVLDFSNREFSEFTREFTGMDLLKKYRLSKGKSLEAYLKHAPRSQSFALLKALMDEWERTRRALVDDEVIEQADSCYRQLHTLKVSLTDGGIGERLRSRGFTSQYLDEQRVLLWEKAPTHPTASIGIAKELIESCCKTILEHHDVSYSITDGLNKLVDKTQQALSINPRDVDTAAPAAKVIRGLLGNLASVARYLAELRNSHGIGHGKSVSYRGLSERHARLAAGAALTLVEYLWATHLETRPGHPTSETEPDAMCASDPLIPPRSGW
ncbi:MAG: abortive infection family protein [Bowdeniella nasicola]|nr:abortive infection family protein [Bowdeniella nasicola]